MHAPGLDFVVYYVADLEHARAFFANTLGFTELPEEAGPGFCQFVDGNGNGFGLALANDETPAAGDQRLYYKTTEDIAALREAWQTQGASVSPLLTRPFGTTFEVTTPDNHTLTALSQGQ